MLIFFFQAEDGIRDAQESRGLGDVYKRQPEPEYPLGGNAFRRHQAFFDEQRGVFREPRWTWTVSYTHLTLPTIYSVYISVVAVSIKKKVISSCFSLYYHPHSLPLLFQYDPY